MLKTRLLWILSDPVINSQYQGGLSINSCKPVWFKLLVTKKNIKGHEFTFVTAISVIHAALLNIRQESKVKNHNSWLVEIFWKNHHDLSVFW